MGLHTDWLMRPWGQFLLVGETSLFKLKWDDVQDLRCGHFAWLRGLDWPLAWFCWCFSSLTHWLNHWPVVKRLKWSKLPPQLNPNYLFLRWTGVAHFGCWCQNCTSASMCWLLIKMFFHNNSDLTLRCKHTAKLFIINKRNIWTKPLHIQCTCSYSTVRSFLPFAVHSSLMCFWYSDEIFF